MTIGHTAPTDDLDRYTRTIADLERRIAELERSGGRAPLALGRRNLFDNGRSKIHQGDPTGTSGFGVVAQSPAGGPGQPVAPADRWKLENYTAQAMQWYGGYPSACAITTSQSAMLHRNFAAVPALATGDFERVSQWIENYRMWDLGWGTAQARPLTVSYAVNSFRAATVIIEVEIVGTNWKCSKPFTLVGGWNLVTVTFPPFMTAGVFTTPNSTNAAFIVGMFTAAGATYNNGNINTLNTVWTNNPAGNTRAAGCTNYWDTASMALDMYDAQAEAGSVFTGFEDVPIDDEQRRCYRYYQSHPFLAMQGRQGATANVAIGRMQAVLPVRMRANPSIAIVGNPTIYDAGGTGSFTPAQVSANYSTPGQIEFDTSGSTIGAQTYRLSIQTYQGGSWTVNLDARI